eukprot:12430328-Karenia_brevis.AAC.1
MESECRMDRRQLKKLLTPAGKAKLERDLSALQKHSSAIRGRKRYWRFLSDRRCKGLRKAREKGGLFLDVKEEVKAWADKELQLGHD